MNYNSEGDMNLLLYAFQSTQLLLPYFFTIFFVLPSVGLFVGYLISVRSGKQFWLFALPIAGLILSVIAVIIISLYSLRSSGEGIGAIFLLSIGVAGWAVFSGPMIAIIAVLNWLKGKNKGHFIFIVPLTLLLIFALVAYYSSYGYPTSEEILNVNSTVEQLLAQDDPNIKELISTCHRFGKTLLRDQCLLMVGQKTNDIKFCDQAQFANSGERTSCVIDFAVKLEEPDFCSKVSDYDKSYCLLYVARQMQSLEPCTKLLKPNSEEFHPESFSACATLAISDINVSGECAKYKEFFDREYPSDLKYYHSCQMSNAIVTGSVEYCHELNSDYNNWEGCFEGAVSKSMNSSQCKQFTKRIEIFGPMPNDSWFIDMYIEACKSYIAVVNQGDFSKCVEIGHPTWKGKCLAKLAKTKKECDQIPYSGGRMACKNTLG